MGMIKNKKAIFFSTDAIIALTIIFVTILVAYPLVQYSKPQPHLQSDIIDSFSSLTISEVDNIYVKSLIAQGLIKDKSKTVLEQIGEFYVTNQSLAKSLANSFLQDLQTNRNVGIWYGTKLIASKNISSYESSKNMEVTSQIISGIEEGKNITGYSSRAYLSSAYKSKYFYFGGYIGDGNITKILDYNGTINSADMELTINNNFSLYINNNFVGSFNESDSEYIPKTYSIPINYFNAGNNTIEFRGKSLYIAGGFIRIAYQSEAEYEQPKRYNFPGINGIINIYDGFYIPSKLNSMNIFLHFNNTYKTFLIIGNTTVYNNTPSGETKINLNNSYLSSLMDYNQLSNKTIPLRLGLENISLANNFSGNADVILITDTSGSMDWRIDSDSTTNVNRTRSCNDPNIYSSNTQRLLLAKCLDSQFVETIIGGTGNRIGLVSFSTDSNSYQNLTNNLTLLNNTINSYTATGSTCISCAINRAYMILNSSNHINRSQYILVMTDGVPNIRSTLSCYNINDISNSSSSIQGVGDSGALMDFNGVNWRGLTPLSSSNLNGISMINSTLGFAAGDSSKFYKYNGTWTETQDLGSNTIYSVSMLNSTLGFAVGSSGKIYKYSGSSWAETQDLGSSILTKVIFFNSTLVYSTASSGNIYKWTGSSFSLDYSGDYSLNSLLKYNSTLGFAAGDSREGIITLNQNSWSREFKSYLYSGNSTTGMSCSDDDSCTLSSSLPMLNANYSSCRVHNELNVTVHSVGFGPMSSCSLATQTLQAIADCGDGNSTASTDPTILQQFYENIANSIIRLSYAEQISEVTANITLTKLYEDSYIEFNYSNQLVPYGLILTLEKQFSNSTFGNFDIPNNSKMLEANVISYSGPRWTNILKLNNNQIYNLSSYGKNFIILGDPFVINIPLDKINVSNNISISTASGPTNVSVGSDYDKIIYTIAKNMSSFSPIVSSAQGCLWNIQFEDGKNSSFKIPTSYNGSDVCYYTSSKIDYNYNDAFQVATYNLFRQLDLSSNNKIDIQLNSQSLQISQSEVSGIPYRWSTQVQVRIWD